MQTYNHNPKLNTELIQQLMELGDELNTEKIDKIAEQEPKIISDLIEIVKDADSFGAEEASWVPIHAVILLRKLNALESIDALIQVALSSEWDEILLSQILIAFSSFGEAVLEPALSAYASAKTDLEREIMLASASSTGIHDHRVFEIIHTEFKKDPTKAAIQFAAYGDKAALPILADTLNKAYEPVLITELAFAIRELGGELAPKQEKKVASAKRKIKKTQE